nr:hypothetical protein [Saccharopolyspora aridisoli]
MKVLADDQPQRCASAVTATSSASIISAWCNRIWLRHWVEGQAERPRGNIGFALAPILVAIGHGSLRATPLLVLPALAGAALCVPVLRMIGENRTSTTASPARGVDDVGSFVKLSLAVVARSIVFIGLSTFIGLHARQRTHGVPAAGTIAFLLFLGGAVGSVLGGRLAQRSPSPRPGSTCPSPCRSPSGRTTCPPASAPPAESPSASP